MKRLLIFCILFVFVFVFQRNTFAQKKVLLYPKAYVSPIDPYSDNSQGNFTSKATQEEGVRHRGWWVIIDRYNVPAYKLPEKNSKQLDTLNFAETFFITDIKEDWYYLVNAIVDKKSITKLNKKIGWVHKDNLLLWNECLVNPRTKIPIKALIVNKPSNFNSMSCNEKQVLKVYKNPIANNFQELIHVNNFCFVYKKTGDRYLLGDISALGRYDTKENLLGWVNKSQLANWNTRIALEPNFTEAGYKERKENEKFQIIAFSDHFAAEEYANNGIIDTNYVVWKRDPVIADSKDLARSDPKRFRGDFMRFPLLSIGGQNKGNRKLPFFKSIVQDDLIVKVKCKNNQIVAVDKHDKGLHKDGFTMKLSETLIDMFPETNADTNSIWMFNRYEIDVPVYFARNVKNAQEPLFSYVLFWTRHDLVRYYAFVEKLVVDISHRSVPEKRLNLVGAYRKLLNEIIGDDYHKNYTEYSIDEIFQILHGVENEGIEFNLNRKKLSCLLDENCTSNVEIEEMIRRFIDVKKSLEKFVKGLKNEFAINRGGESFFWIKLEDTY